MIRHHRFRGAALAIAAGLAVALVAGVATAADRTTSRSGLDFDWSGTVARGNTIEIKGINGAIEARPTTGPKVRVTAVKHARWGADPDDVRIDVSEDKDGVRVCVLYPDMRDCDDHHHGRNHKDDVTVDFQVEVPAGVNFLGQTVNGEITADRLDGDAEATTVNGSIRVTASGFVQATTVNGSIHAAMGTRDWRHDAEFTTVNGSITLELEGSPNAEVHATTVNGSISTDFPLTVRGKFIGRSISGTLGDGGPELKMTTVNGSIKLRSST